MNPAPSSSAPTPVVELPDYLRMAPSNDNDFAGHDEVTAEQFPPESSGLRRRDGCLVEVEPMHMQEQIRFYLTWLTDRKTYTTYHLNATNRTVARAYDSLTNELVAGPVFGVGQLEAELALRNEVARLVEQMEAATARATAVTTRIVVRRSWIARLLMRARAVAARVFGGAQ